MKKITHALYIATITILSIALWGQLKKSDTSSIASQMEVESFYAIIKPNDPETYIVSGYQPDLEIRNLNGLRLPFIKGTDHLIVALNTKGEKKGEQWIWRAIPSEYGLPQNSRFISLEDEWFNQVPEAYKAAFMAHNHDRSDVGEMMFKALFLKGEFTVTHVNFPSNMHTYVR